MTRTYISPKGYRVVEGANAGRIRAVVPLGDAVASVAEPIRRALRIPKCPGCLRRRATLNKMMPNINPLARHD